MEGGGGMKQECYVVKNNNNDSARNNSEEQFHKLTDLSMSPVVRAQMKEMHGER